MVTAHLALLLVVAAHSRSEGTSRFVVDADGRVDVAVTLTVPDVPELCDADLAIVDPARHAAAEQRFTTCVEQGLPRWLRLRVDDAACDVLAGSWRRGEGHAVVLSTQAVCLPPSGHALTIDWGLFHDSPLEHVSTTTIVLPDGSERRTLMSRRHNRAVVDVAGPLWRRVLPAAAAVVGAVALVAFVVRRRRRRASEQAR
jgi:hypothetical protein